MKQFYKNFLDLSVTPDPDERRKNISKEIIKHADYLPKTLSYEEIDKSFKEWVENEINIVQDGIKLPTMVLYSNQRFSEYMQTWKYTDENNNIRLNFKTITRDSNPSHGTIVGDTYNIPGDRYYTFKSIQAIDESGKKYRIDYKMRQPTAVDFNYKVSIMTNRYTTINEFNEVIQRLFNARQCYIAPNGHYMSIVVETISDESEYNIQDRQFFSQTVNLKLKGYIIREEDFRVEENPIATVLCFEGDNAKRRKPLIELSEYEPICVEEKELCKQEIDIDVDFSYCFPFKGKTKFTMDEDFILTNLILEDNNNIIEDNIKLYVNDILISENLYNDSFEGYKKLDYIPEDLEGNLYNDEELKEIPLEKIEDYKYILFNNEYYIWHQIKIFNGDEIVIQTEKIKRYENVGKLTLNGYHLIECEKK